MGIGNEKLRELNNGKLEKHSSSIEMSEYIPSKEVEIKINHKDSPLILSEQSQIEIKGDIREIGLLTIYKENTKYIYFINSLLNDNSFLDNQESLLQVCLLVQKILPFVIQNMKIIKILEKDSVLIQNGIMALLQMMQTSNLEKMSTDASSEEDG